MKPVKTNFVESAHAYTRSDVPWAISVGETAYAKMISYISGGGMKTFGRTVRQEEVRRRQMRFLVVFSVLAALWLFFLVF